MAEPDDDLRTTLAGVTDALDRLEARVAAIEARLADVPVSVALETGEVLTGELTAFAEGLRTAMREMASRIQRDLLNIPDALADHRIATVAQVRTMLTEMGGPVAASPAGPGRFDLEIPIPRAPVEGDDDDVGDDDVGDDDEDGYEAAPAEVPMAGDVDE